MAAIQPELIFGLVAGLLKNVPETEIMQYPDRAKWCDLKQKWRGFRK